MSKEENKESREGGINESKGNLEYTETEEGKKGGKGRDGGGGRVSGNDSER